MKCHPNFSIAFYLLIYAATAQAQIISVNDFGAVPNSDEDATPAFRKAVAACNARRIATLTMQQGVYHFHDPKAIADFNLLMNGQLDNNTPWGRAGYPFNAAMIFKDCNKIKIDGNGSVLQFEGLIQPFGFYNCKNISLDNITIDVDGRLPYSAGEIVEIRGDSIQLKILDQFPVHGNEPVWCYVDYDPQTQQLAQVYNYGGTSPLKIEHNQLAWITDPKASEMKKGRWLFMQHIGVYRPSIHFLDCNNIAITNVKLLAQAGMGIIAHRCNNFTARKFEVRKGVGRFRSINRDAVHFISCKGLIDFEDCYFEGMGDDAINVHGFYFVIEKILDDRTLLIKTGRETQDQQLDYPDAGDSIEFVHPNNLSPFAKAVVVKVYPDTIHQSVRVVFNKLPSDVDSSVLLANLTQVASLRFVHCTVRDNCARGALVQTRNVLIENCLFDHCTGTGIDVNTAKNWYESIGTRNVVIRNNNFNGCGYSLGGARQAAGICIRTEAEAISGIHKNILVEGNYIDGGAKFGLVATNAEHVRFRKNTIKNVEVPYQLNLCTDCEVEDH